MKDENKEKVVWMKGIWATQKNGSQVGQIGVASVEEYMVHFPLIIFFLFFLLLKFWMCMNMCVLGNISWKIAYIGRDPNKMWKAENL